MTVLLASGAQDELARKLIERQPIIVDHASL
jgi:hypothetical protein